jgi:GT2 family glycosyltransferase
VYPRPMRFLGTGSMGIMVGQWHSVMVQEDIHREDQEDCRGSGQATGRSGKDTPRPDLAITAALPAGLFPVRFRRGKMFEPRVREPVEQGTEQLVERGLVSVIIVNLDGMQFIESLFRSLFQQTYLNLEVLFFDNGSTDASVEYVRRNFPMVRVFELRENAGFSRPNNMGIRMSRGQYILALNLDVELEKDFVDELVKGIESDSRIGWVAGKMLRLTSSGRSEEIDCLGHHLDRDRYAKETDHSQPFRWEDYSQCRNVFGASASAALYRRGMLEDIAINNEYFDEDFVAYWEDVDLDWRAQLMGWKCLYVPTAVGYHIRGGSGLHKRPQVAAHYLANRFLLVAKNDELWHLFEDAAPFITRSASDLYLYLNSSPSAIPLAVGIFFRNLPRALMKRRTIQRKRRVTSSYIRSIIR